MACVGLVAFSLLFTVFVGLLLWGLLVWWRFGFATAWFALCVCAFYLVVWIHVVVIMIASFCVLFSILWCWCMVGCVGYLLYGFTWLCFCLVVLVVVFVAGCWLLIGLRWFTRLW